MSDEKVRVLEAVKTPLAFFVLVVLLVEVIFGIAAKYLDQQRTIIVVAMVTLIFLLVLIVAFLAYRKPEALKGVRYCEDPELSNIRQNFQEVEHLAGMITGEWKFVSLYQPEGAQQTVEVRGSCEITKGKYGISMRGNCEDQNGNPEAPFVIKQVFINEDGLTYIFEVPIELGQATLGVGQVRFIHAVGETVISQMKGNWAVLGSRGSGKATFNRKN
jgi:hypothetical protein